MHGLKILQKSFLGLVQTAPCRIDIEFKDAEGRPFKKLLKMKSKTGAEEEIPLYTTKDDFHGEVYSAIMPQFEAKAQSLIHLSHPQIRVTPLTTGKKIEHQGIKVQLLGQIELASERGTHHEFVSLVRELAPPGEFPDNVKTFPFEFRNVELQYDSYRGPAVRCRYLIKVTVTGKGMTPDSKSEAPFWVRNYEEAVTEVSPPIKMEVGIEECLHIEFEYNKARYHLSDVVVGRINFLLVRIKLKHMEVEIRRKETTGAGEGTLTLVTLFSRHILPLSQTRTIRFHQALQLTVRQRLLQSTRSWMEPQ